MTDLIYNEWVLSQPNIERCMCGDPVFQAGRCRTCWDIMHEPPPCTVDGCDNSLEGNQRKYCTEHGDEMKRRASARAKRRYQEKARETDICIVCLKNPAEGHRVTCMECQTARNERRRRIREELASYKV